MNYAMPIKDKDDTDAGSRTQFYSEDLLPPPPSTSGMRASLIVISGPEIGREYSLDRPETIIGRGLDAHIKVHSTAVSRQHARVVRSPQAGGDLFRLEDMKSLNGTLVNNQTLDSVTLQEGDKIQVGDVVLKFAWHDAMDAQFHRMVHQLIHYDSLTGLMTMDSFRQLLKEAFTSPKAVTPFTLSMTDIDGLKKVNDNHGHLAGRMVVREMGVIIRAALRSADKAALYGGDETIILYPSAIEEARAVAEQIREGIANHVFEFGEARFSVSISQGLAQWPMHGHTPEELIASADAALYQAKADGRNCVRLA